MLIVFADPYCIRRPGSTEIVYILVVLVSAMRERKIAHVAANCRCADSRYVRCLRKRASRPRFAQRMSHNGCLSTTLRVSSYGLEFSRSTTITGGTEWEKNRLRRAGVASFRCTAKGEKTLSFCAEIFLRLIQSVWNLLGKLKIRSRTIEFASAKTPAHYFFGDLARL